MRRILILLILFFILAGCSKKDDIVDSPGRVLAKIGNSIIREDEFIKRAEYTIRPIYCKGDLNIHKKIVLNSLIAEKLMAMEVNSDSIVNSNKYLQNYIRGRKEQVMREMLYYNEGTKKVELDESEVSEIYKNAGKKYQLYFINFPNVSVASDFLDYLQKQNITFDEGAKNYLQKEDLPIQEITYESVQNKEIHDILFKSKVDKSKIYGPIKTVTGNAIVFKVAGWTDRKAITDSQIRLRHNDVIEKTTRIKADEIYNGYVHQLMAGKSMDFNGDTFIRLASLYAELYHIKKRNKKELFNKEIWGKDAELEKVDSLNIKFQDLKNAVLLDLDGVKWTVEKFQQELQSHPLVFRKDNISAREFPNQFRLAVADLIRDKFITADAYAKGYDNLAIVKDQTAMWQDNIIANYQRDKYLIKKGFAENFNVKYMAAIDEYLNPLVDSLQTKYSSEIFIDTEMFNNIHLTRIDLFAMKNNVPYPIVVPGFPILTTDNRLDYGNKMVKE